ncbi:MAG: hypothetical protein ACPG47_08340 [Leucothrix sp.]
MRDFKSSIFRALTILLLLIAAVLFCISMVEIVYVTEEKGIHGYWILLTGWLGFLFFQFAWYANPLTVLSLLLMRQRPWWALLAGACALLCMSQAFLFHEIPTDAQGNTIAIVSRGAGFYCWVGMVCCIFYAIVMRLIYRALKRDSVAPKAPANSTLAPRYAAQNSINTVPLSYPNGVISTKTNP